MHKIELYTLQAQGKMISDKELDIFISLWPEFHPIRLCIELGAFVGLRAYDIVRTKVPGVSSLEGFSDDFMRLDYVVSKPCNRGYTIRHKVHHREIPIWLANKLQLYFRNNIYTFKGNRMFPFSADYIRDEICKMRIKQGHRYPFLNDIWQVLVRRDGSERITHRISFHTLRARATTEIIKGVGNNLPTWRYISAQG